jgi:4-oxalocrotonate tautomerase
MPIIHIEIARGRSAQELGSLAGSVSRAAADALAVPEAGIRILVAEVDPTLWYSGGQSLADKQQAKA